MVSRLSATRKLLLAGTWTNCQPFVEVRLVATVMKSIALVQSGLISVLLESKGATQEARFSSYCRLLPPRQIAKLLKENKITGAGDGNRTHVRNLGNLRSERQQSWEQLGNKTLTLGGAFWVPTPTKAIESSSIWRKRVGVEPTIRPAKDRITGFEGRESHRTLFASGNSIAWDW